MIALNHALTGALIGLSVHNPALALPAAFLSHFILDMVPHFGAKPELTKTRGFVVYLALDACSCILLVGILFASHHPHWLQASVAAFLAASPDFLWIRMFLAARAKQAIQLSKLEKLLIGIQWFERPIGIVVEAVWAVGAAVLLSAIL